MPPAPLSAEEQDLLTWLLSSIPRWFWLDDPRFSVQEVWVAIVKAMIRVQRQGEDWVRATYILFATDVWLNQHARDRATFRQAGELDPTVRQRLRTIPDVLTRSAILTEINSILVAAGVVGTAAMLELPQDGAFIGRRPASITGVGGTFVQVGTISKFTPTALPWSVPPYQGPNVFPGVVWELVTSGAANVANNGTRTITGLEINAALVTNGTGVSSVDAIVTWTARRKDTHGNLIDGFTRAYVGRGYRISIHRPFRIVVILPFGTSDGTLAGVREAMRTKKAAGFGVIIERRLVP